MKKLLLALLSLFAISMAAQNNLDTAMNLTASEKIFRTPEVDTKPQLKNGINTLSAFIGNEYRFPEIKNKKIKIFVSFIVEIDGSLTDVKAFYVNMTDLVAKSGTTIPETEEQKNLHAKQTALLKNEAVRVLKAFPEKWIPAIIGGKQVRCLYNYPINFNIE